MPFGEVHRRLSGRVSLSVSGLPTTIRITADHLERVYLPLLAMLDDMRRTRGGRVLAGLAGIPGSGKSTFTAVLSHVADAVLGPGRLVAVGLDGWHWPNAVLDARTTRDAAGREIPLRRRKGGPESYDVQAFAAALRELRAADQAGSLPIYDRRRHEPVANGLTVDPSVTLVLVEGNFVLSDATPWARVAAMLEPKLFLTCDRTEAGAGVVDRHVRGGATAEEAVAKFEANDRLNTEFVLETAARIDVRIRVDDETGDLR